MELKPLGHLILADPYDLGHDFVKFLNNGSYSVLRMGLAPAIPGYVLHLTGQ